MQAREDYIQRYGVSLYEVLDFFSLFDMYHSWWFSAILLFLVINLIACSLQRFPGVWSQIFRGTGSSGLEDSMLKTLPYVEKVRISNPAKARTEEDIRNSLRKWFKKQERIETESVVTFFSEKGRFSQTGSIHYPSQPSHHSGWRHHRFAFRFQRICEHPRRGDRGSNFCEGKGCQSPKAASIFGALR